MIIISHDRPLFEFCMYAHGRHWFWWVAYSRVTTNTLWKAVVSYREQLFNENSKKKCRNGRFASVCKIDLCECFESEASPSSRAKKLDKLNCSEVNSQAGWRIAKTSTRIKKSRFKIDSERALGTATRMNYYVQMADYSWCGARLRLSVRTVAG